MARKIFTLLCAVVFTVVWAQDDSLAGRQTRVVYCIDDVDVKPEFPGGTEAMYHFVGDNIKFPSTCSIPVGRVVILFDIEPDGEITNIRPDDNSESTWRSVLEKMAMDALKDMPRWSPAYKDGVPVKCTYRVPFTFKEAEDSICITTRL